MSQQLINHSPDLKRLRDEGYDLEIRSNHLLVKSVPYLTTAKTISVGTLVCTLTLAGNITTVPDDHQAYFIGEAPCDKDGIPNPKIINSSSNRDLGPGVVINHTFSAKPTSGRYNDYYEKVSTYVAILSGPAEALDRSVTAKVFRVIEPGEDESPFLYMDTASSRAGIGTAMRKLDLNSVGIIGLGGTGSYILDLIAKTPVKEVHLFDGDAFLQHNAFRSPGAPSLEELREKPTKVAYFERIYSRMRRGIIGHPEYVDGVTIEKLVGLEFVFLCLDGGPAKKVIVEKLEELKVPFIDVGMGLYLSDNASLGGIVRVTTSTEMKREHVRESSRIPFFGGDANNEYNRNIQIADLNALNAALAVIRWKKHLGFYLDFEREHFCTYTIDGNILGNEDKTEI